MGIIKEPLHALLTESVFMIPGLGALAKSAGHISVGQGLSRKKALEKAVCLLRKKRNVLIFPEGTVSQNNVGLKPFHTGTVRMALKTKRPIVPVGIYLDPGKIHQGKTIINDRSEVIDWYRHGPYVVTFGQPYYLTGHESNRRLVVEQTKILQCKLQVLYDRSRLVYTQRNEDWKKRKALLEQKLGWITRLRLLPSYSPRYIRPIVALLTFWNRVGEFLTQQKFF